MHHKAKDWTGQVFGKLTAKAYQGSDGRKSLWLFECSCGGSIVKSPTEVVKHLKKGGVPGCGCFRGARLRPKEFPRKDNPLFNVWRAMVARCYNPKARAYLNYGARGISVCEAWRSDFDQFMRDMSMSYKPGLTLERANNDQGYSPENCIWVTPKDQALNKRNSLGLDILTISLRTGISRSTLYYRWKQSLSMTSSMPDPGRVSWFEPLEASSQE